MAIRGLSARWRTSPSLIQKVVTKVFLSGARYSICPLTWARTFRSCQSLRRSSALCSRARDVPKLVMCEHFSEEPCFIDVWWGGSTGDGTSALLSSRSDCALALAMVNIIPKRGGLQESSDFTIGVATSPPSLPALFQSSKLRTPPWNLFLIALDQSHLITRASL